MRNRNRKYSKDLPEEKLRDCKLFVIACEGTDREPAYFKFFRYMSPRIKVHVIDDNPKKDKNNNEQSYPSAPRWVLDKAITYVDQIGLTEEDEVWLVIDTDCWKDNQIRMLADHCKENKNWHLAISNPCFEVWLYLHKIAEIEYAKCETSQEFKHELSKLEIGGYHPHKFIPLIETAIQNARKVDKDSSYFLPAPKSTKVYFLAEALMKKIGKNNFQDFLTNKLPLLIRNKE